MQNKTHRFSIVFFTLLFFTGTALASDLMIYPNKGQSQKKQDQDQSACYSWAKNKSGFDPMAAPTATTPPPAGDGANPVRGAARGALALSLIHI